MVRGSGCPKVLVHIDLCYVLLLIVKTSLLQLRSVTFSTLKTLKGNFCRLTWQLLKSIPCPCCQTHQMMQAGCDEPTVGGTCWGSVLFSTARDKVVSFFLSLMWAKGSGEAKEPRRQCQAASMGSQSANLLIALQIVPGFFCNCLFLALYDSLILLKHVVLLLSRSKSARHEWRRMLTSEGLRCVWNSFLLDAYKQAKLGEEAPNSSVVHVTSDQKSTNDCRKCGILDFASSERPMVVNFGSSS